MQVFTGKVKAYDSLIGKGLITPDAGGEDVSVDRRRSAESPLSEGQKVAFRMIHWPDGVFAYDVKLI